MEGVRKINYSVEEAAEALGLSKPSVYQLCRSTDFPCQRIAGRTLINIALLEEWSHRKAAENMSKEEESLCQAR